MNRRAILLWALAAFCAEIGDRLSPITGLFRKRQTLYPQEIIYGDNREFLESRRCRFNERVIVQFDPETGAYRFPPA